MTPRMFSSTRKCWPSDFFGATLTGGRRPRPRSRACGPPSSAGVLAAASASAATVWTTCAGSFGRPRTGCGARYGLSVSTRIRSAGTARAASRSSSAFGIRDVAGERDVVAALEGGREQLGRGEAVEDDRAAEGRERVGRVLRGLAAVDHDRQPELVRRARAARRRAARCSSGVAYSRTLSSPVSPTATAFGCASSSRSSSSRPASGPAACAGRSPSAAYTPSCASAIASARPARVDPGADRDDPRHAGRAAALDERRRPAPRTRRGARASRSRGRRPLPCARARRRRRVSASSFAKSGVGSRSACPGGSALGSQRPTHVLVVAGEDDVLASSPSSTVRNSSGPAIRPS